MRSWTSPRNRWEGRLEVDAPSIPLAEMLGEDADRAINEGRIDTMMLMLSIHWGT
jgi:hypothetical protein